MTTSLNEAASVARKCWRTLEPVHGMIYFVDAGLRGVEALVLHGASGEVSPRVLKDSRAWSDSAWNAAVDELRSRGLLEGDDLSTRGTELRAGIEDRTDELAAPAWAAIGVDDAARLRSIVRPWSKAIAQTSFGFR